MKLIKFENYLGMDFKRFSLLLVFNLLIFFLNARIYYNYSQKVYLILFPIYAVLTVLLTNKYLRLFYLNRTKGSLIIRQFLITGLSFEFFRNYLPSCLSLVGVNDSDARLFPFIIFLSLIFILFIGLSIYGILKRKKQELTI